ncbi:hypothetical protein ACSBR1_025565 [Camellia fascicularis]
MVPPWEIMTIVADIRKSARDRSWRFLWTRRSNNRVAHWVANAQSRSTMSCLPQKLVFLLSAYKCPSLDHLQQCIRPCIKFEI